MNSNNFIKTKTRNSDSDNDIYYKLLIKNDEGKYNNWLSTRCTCAYSSYNFWLQVIYTNGSTKGSGVGAYCLYGSSENSDRSGGWFLRPVVTIPASQIDLSTNYDTNGYWNLREQ